MDVGRLGRGELIAAISGVALLILMFLPWFSTPEIPGLEQAQEFAEQFGGPEVETSVDFNAWESFDFIDLVLLLTVIVAVGLGVAGATARTVALPVAASALTAGLGILATLLVLYRIIDPPAELDRDFWLFLGLIAAAGVAAGGWMSMQEEGATFGGAAREAGDRLGGGPPPPGGPPGGAPPPPGGAPPPPPSGEPPSEAPPSAPPPGA